MVKCNRSKLGKVTWWHNFSHTMNPKSNFLEAGHKIACIEGRFAPFLVRANDAY